MVLSNVIVDITISRRSFVLSQSRARVSAGFTNVSSLAVAAIFFIACNLFLGVISARGQVLSMLTLRAM